MTYLEYIDELNKADTNDEVNNILGKAIGDNGISASDFSELTYYVSLRNYN